MDVLFTDREADLMEMLWDHGPSTVADVRARLKAELAYNTVLTILRTLEAKGYVAHIEEGRAHRYKPLVTRDAARGSALRNLASKLFKGSTELLLTHLVSDNKLSSAEIKRIRQLLDQRSRKERS
jgi:BlaI family penicillinase repressor